MRDYRSLLAHDKCWDRRSQDLFEQHGEAIEDAILQNREELILLCEFIEQNHIRSYLEIGTWTGRVISTLHRIFHFERLAACDDGYCERFGLSISLPDGCEFFRGNTASQAFRRWRADLGMVDLVFIDANHAYRAVKSDFLFQRSQPHRFIALHDITGHSRQTRGVRRFWEELDSGHKIQFIQPHVELGLAQSTMGIGIWTDLPEGTEP